MKLTLARKLGLGFGAVLTLVVAGVALSYMNLNAISGSQSFVVTERVPTVESLKDLQRDLNQTSAKARQGILAGNELDRMQDAVRSLNLAWDAINKDTSRLDELSNHWIVQENRDRLAQTKNELADLRVMQESIMKAAAGEDRESIVKAGNDYADRVTPKVEAIKVLLDEVASSNDKLLHQETDEMITRTQRMETMMVGGTLATVVISVLLAVFLSKRISEATHAVLTQAEAIASGDLTQDDLEVRSEDELGQLTVAINKMSGSLRSMILAINDNAQHVATASEQLSSTSQQITANAEETSAQANVVSNAAQQVNTNLQSVSTGAEEMTSTIQSIASNAHEAATVASNAVQTAQAANSTVAKLGDSSAEIGEVIKVITSIAQQTNLLALNATIEAARAGEAGKGFAVVANEVKELAKQTAKATEDISRKITAIQTDTKGAVEAIGSITGVISQVNDISGTIATAVEEQSATTNEMTRNVGDAAKGSGEITHNIAGVAEAARGTSNSAQESQKAANELAEMAEQLRGLVSQFRINETAGGSGLSSSPKPARTMAARAGK
jgi:methyl-accepting chemotaxis protein